MMQNNRKSLPIRKPMMQSPAADRQFELHGSIHFPKRILQILLAAVLIITMLPSGVLGTGIPAKAETTTSALILHNPIFTNDSTMTAGQSVVWSCVWFGSYPQTEIVDKASTSGCYGKTWVKDSDYEVDASLYKKLQNASYDDAGDTTINGVKYRRITSGNATAASDGTDVTATGMYYWDLGISYHYFRYDPIKWRVLYVNNGKAFLLADVALDDQLFNQSSVSTTWETSTIRSWLNGYGSDCNNCGTDYTDTNFIDTAFTSTESAAILSSSVVNGGDSGNDTTDKIFLLADADVYGTANSTSLGFSIKSYLCDEARRCNASAYAKAMGAQIETSEEYPGYCNWWLRTSDSWSSTFAAYILTGGNASSMDVTYDLLGCRPALVLNLYSPGQYSLAGAVNSNGTETCSLGHYWNDGEITLEPTTEAEGIKTYTCTVCGATETEPITKLVGQRAVTITASNVTKTYSTSSRTFTLNADSDGVASLTFTSNNKNITVNKDTGKVTIKAKYIGQATITISSEETLYCKAAVKKITVKVNPTKTTLSSATNLKGRKLKVSWKKNSCGTGYKVMYSRSSKFASGNKTVTIKKNSTLSTTITGLTKGKTYYVKIRTYKVVSGTYYYSDWSSVKKVKITK